MCQYNLICPLCRCECAFQQSNPVHVEVKTSPCDYLSIIINAVIAFSAVATFVWPRLAEWFFHRYKLIIPDATRFDCREEEDGGGDAGFGPMSARDVIYSLPVENNGNVKLYRCEIQTDCVLKKGKDGISFETVHTGIPRIFTDVARGATFDLPVNDKAYIRFLKFTPDQMKQSGMKGTEDLEKGKPPSGDSAKSNGTKPEEPIKYTWGIQAKCRNSTEESLKLDVGINVDYFVHIQCKAENLKNTYSTWISIHWSGEKVDNENLTIKPASKEESEKANECLLKLEKGE